MNPKESDSTTVIDEVKVDHIKCDSVVWPVGGNISHGSTEYTDYESGIRCEYRQGGSTGDVVFQDGSKPDFADNLSEDLGSGVSLKSLPDDASVSIGDMRTSVSSDTGWECTFWKYDGAPEGQLRRDCEALD